MGTLLVGTSGYLYRHWRRFCIELNTTFYRLPSPEAVDGWRQNIRVSK